MAAQLAALSFKANDPTALTRFWSGLLGWRAVADHSHGDAATALLPDDDTGFQIRFLPSPALKSGPNRIHFDLTSETPQAQRDTVRRSLALGAQHLDVGQLPEEEHVVLADPEGNEFCVIEAGNGFLAGCGFIGALSSDGSQRVGHFWSEALGWPLVWDQDEETAIQSPHGGPKITWGGPPIAAKVGENRLHLDLAVPTADELAAEMARLVGLGATRTDLAGAASGGMVLLDPDGNEFCVGVDPV